MTLPSALITAAMSATEPFGLRRVAEDDLFVGLELVEELGVGEEAAFAVLDGNRHVLAGLAARGEGRVCALDAHVTSRQTNESEAFGRSAPGRRPASQRI